MYKILFIFILLGNLFFIYTSKADEIQAEPHFATKHYKQKVYDHLERSQIGGKTYLYRFINYRQVCIKLSVDLENTSDRRTHLEQQLLSRIREPIQQLADGDIVISNLSFSQLIDLFSDGARIINSLVEYSCEIVNDPACISSFKDYSIAFSAIKDAYINLEQTYNNLYKSEPLFSTPVLYGSHILNSSKLNTAQILKERAEHNLFKYCRSSEE